MWKYCDMTAQNHKVWSQRRRLVLGNGLVNVTLHLVISATIKRKNIGAVERGVIYTVHCNGYVNYNKATAKELCFLCGPCLKFQAARCQDLLAVNRRG
jgi:hypothetical protein